jgi:dihydrofolate reductase
MRRIVMFNRVSADGYFAAADGNLDWVVQDGEVDREAASSIPGFDAMLFGRVTYGMFESFWPHALEDANTAPNPHRPGHPSKELRAMAVWINDAQKIVFSKSKKKVSWKNSRLLPAIDGDEIRALKEGPGKDILIFGSASVVSELTRLGLIDEYQFVVSPLLLGSGRSLVRDVAKGAKLQLLDAKAFPSGNVKLRYSR